MGRSSGGLRINGVHRAFDDLGLFLFTGSDKSVRESLRPDAQRITLTCAILGGIDQVDRFVILDSLGGDEHHEGVRVAATEAKKRRKEQGYRERPAAFGAG